MDRTVQMPNITMPLVSVIVPVYKVEPYLCQCIDSIIAQTYKNLEIILVDDGSTDNCPAICDAYATKDNRIKVIHKMNGGLSDARNAGLGLASGEYLMFVDSDDWVENNAVALLYQLLITNNAQIAIGGVQRVEDQTNRVLQSEFHGEIRIENMTKTQAMQAFFQNGCAAWGRLYHRSVHSEIEFPVGEINEDEAIVLYLLERCNVVAQTNKVVYNYRCRAESITTSAFSENKLAWYRHCEKNLIWIRRKHLQLESYAIDRLCSSVLWSLTEIALGREYDPKWVNELKICLAKNYVIFKDNYSHGIKQTIRLFVLRYIPFEVYRYAIRTKRRHRRIIWKSECRHWFL